MSKKRRKAESDEDEELIDSARDPLGKLLEQYHVSLAGVLIVAGIISLIGLGIAIYSQFRETYSLIWLLVGTGVLLLAVVFLGMNVFNVGRRLELRKRG